jgi:oligosaccharide reducing-end xylanase
VDAKVEKVVQQYFHGGSDEVIYYEVGSDQAQIRDIASNDVRSEGQSYGMLITVSMGMKVEFDKLWNYASKCMQQPSGTFGWQYRHGACSAMSTGSAPDGEEYFAMALTLASRRWGDGTGVNYAAEAKKVMNTMIKVNFFNKDPAVVRFVVGSPEADPSYVLPLFYSEWACLDTDNTSFWKKATTDAYTFFHKATNASTGLNPYRSNFNGVPSPGNLGIFQSDPWRVPMNIMMDYNLNKTDAKWQEQYAQTHAAFWVKEGLTSYGNQYALDGTKLQGNHGPGLDAVNAMLAFALPPGDPNAKALLERAWTITPQTGNQRYYAGCLYMLSFIHMSGKFQLFY